MTSLLTAERIMDRHAIQHRPSDKAGHIKCLAEWTRREPDGRVSSGATWEDVPLEIDSLRDWLGY
jgi:hypothetical protein